MPRGQLAATFAAIALFLAVPSVASAQSFPLVGWWPMNEGSGQTVRDWSGKGNHGFLGSTSGVDDNDPSWIRGVFLGSALRFDGGKFVTIPVNNDVLEPAKLTVAAWIRGATSPGKGRYIVAKGANGCFTGSYGIYSGSNGGAAFYIADSPFTYIASPEAPESVWDGKWHHVAGTYDGSTVRLYVDGVEVGNGASTSSPIAYGIGDDSGQIGGYPGQGSCPSHIDLTLRGDVDGVQVWSQALPVDRIWSALKSIVTLAR